MPTLTSKAAVAMLVGASVLGCSTATASPSPSAHPAPSSSLTIEVPAAGASSDPSAASLDAARAIWASGRPSSFAYTFTHHGPGGVGWDWSYRVTSLDGSVESQAVDGTTGSADMLARITPDGLFDTLRQGSGGAGETHARFDPALGYPAEITHAEPSASDGDWTETVTEFTSDPASVARDTKAVLRQAREDWQHWEPDLYEYVWHRFGAAGGPGAGTTWRVRHGEGRSTTEAGPGSDGAWPADQASVAATFDAVGAALDAGAWVDLTVEPTTGLPLLVAVDPSSSVTGDEYWIRIEFRNIEREVARSAVEAAMTRWDGAALERFSYVWRYRGELDPLTYRVSYDGDVSRLRRAAGTPIPEARSYATPRIDDTFRMIEDVLGQGGRVSATYDPVLGYPIRVRMDPHGDDGAPGMITIKDFEIP